MAHYAPILAYPVTPQPAGAQPQPPRPSLATVQAEIAEYRRHQQQAALVWQQLQRRLAAAQS